MKTSLYIKGLAYLGIVVTIAVYAHNQARIEIVSPLGSQPQEMLQAAQDVTVLQPTTESLQNTQLAWQLQDQQMSIQTQAGESYSLQAAYTEASQ